MTIHIDFHNTTPHDSIKELERIITKCNTPSVVRCVTGHGITRDLIKGYLLNTEIKWVYDGNNEGCLIFCINEE